MGARWLSDEAEAGHCSVASNVRPTIGRVHRHRGGLQGVRKSCVQKEAKENRSQ